MAIRDSKELGSNLFVIAKRLLQNQNLCKLLINDNENPLDIEIEDTLSLLNKNIKVVPKIQEEEFNREGKIALVYPYGATNEQNSEFKLLRFHVLIYTPLDTWVINDENLRPFLVMSEIEKSLKDKRINGIGTMRFKDFELTTLTDKLSCYKMEFSLDVFN